MEITNEYTLGKVLLIDKPIGWSSFNVVKKVRYFVKTPKVGHAGTLDPLATGLLIICTGKFTKQINEYMGMPKEYIGTITLGATTPTFDLESEPQNFIETNHLIEHQIIEATKSFIGNIFQVPPQHSAIKKDGKRLYESARLGIEVKIDPRPITIYSFDIEQIEKNIVHFKVSCSTGTYIRSLANDFGAALGVGGYLSSLRRTKIGDFSADDAQTVEQFEEMMKLNPINSK